MELYKLKQYFLWVNKLDDDFMLPFTMQKYGDAKDIVFQEDSCNSH